jgi:hypothetical protein
MRYRRREGGTVAMAPILVGFLSALVLVYPSIGRASCDGELDDTVSGSEAKAAPFTVPMESSLVPVWNAAGPDDIVEIYAEIGPSENFRSPVEAMLLTFSIGSDNFTYEALGPTAVTDVNAYRIRAKKLDLSTLMRGYGSFKYVGKAPPLAR